VLPLVQIVQTPYRYAGILLIGIGIWLNIWGDGLFKREKTTIKPFEQSSVLIVEGPFRFSRHPMYLGMVAILLGVAIICGSLITFVAPITFFIIMSVVFVPVEEKAMEVTFGNEYLEYKARVRQWL